jgi:hypothetical protein
MNVPVARSTTAKIPNPRSCQWPTMPHRDRHAPKRDSGLPSTESSCITRGSACIAASGSKSSRVNGRRINRSVSRMVTHCSVDLGHAGATRRVESARRCCEALGRAFTPGSRLDGVQKRCRRLVGPQPRERRCTFRCSTDCACEAAAAFFRLTPSRRSQSPVVNARASAHRAPSAPAPVLGHALSYRALTVTRTSDALIVLPASV